MRDITVADLREMLEGLDDELIIRVAEQPSYPLQLAIWDELRRIGDVVYIRTSEHPYEVNPYAPRAAFGDVDIVGEGLECMNCGDPAERVIDDPETEGDLEALEPVCSTCAERRHFALRDLTDDERAQLRERVA